MIIETDEGSKRKIFDVHCHLYSLFKKHRGIDRILKKARDAGFSHIIATSTRFENAKINLILKAYYDFLEKDFILLSFGIQPHTVTRYDQLYEKLKEQDEPVPESRIEFIKEMIKEEKKSIRKLIGRFREKVVAIGEIGLDREFTHEQYLKGEYWELKEKLLRYFLNVAKKEGKPAIIHSVGAEIDVLDILRKYERDEPRVVLHLPFAWYDVIEVTEEYARIRRFTKLPGKKRLWRDELWTRECWEEYEKILDYFIEEGIKRGYYFSVGPEDKSGRLSTGMQKIVEKVPLEYLLTETDAPRSKRRPVKLHYITNVPKQIYNIKRKELQEQGIGLEDVYRILFENAESLFIK